MTEFSDRVFALHGGTIVGQRAPDGPSVRTTESSSRWCFRPLPRGAFVSYGFSEEFRPSRTPCSTLKSSWPSAAQPASGNSLICNPGRDAQPHSGHRASAGRSSSNDRPRLGFTISIALEIARSTHPIEFTNPTRRACDRGVRDRVRGRRGERGGDRRESASSSTTSRPTSSRSGTRKTRAAPDGGPSPVESDNAPPQRSASRLLLPRASRRP
jgi:hypothetical protein